MEGVYNWIKERLQDMGFTVYFLGARKTARVGRTEPVAIVLEPNISNKAEGIPLSIVMRVMKIDLKLIQPRPASRREEFFTACLNRLENAFLNLKSHIGENVYGTWFLVGVTKNDYKVKRRFGSCEMNVTLEFKGYDVI